MKRVLILIVLMVSIIPTIIACTPTSELESTVTPEEEEPPIVAIHPSFSFSDLTIEPISVLCGEEVTITISITNIGKNQDSQFYANQAFYYENSYF